MHMPSTTANQHFLSRTEQELNALNPTAQHRRNQRIYSFCLVDREKHHIRLDDAEGRHISGNLALTDLFSFSVINKRKRFNFEHFFGQYEASLRTNTIELLEKLRISNSDIKKEIIEIFAAKLMNFLRNPYSIKKVLNSIGGMLQFLPTDPCLLADYRAVLGGKKPQQEYLCRQLGIDADEYQKWLAALFMALFRPRPGEINLMEGMIKGLFENRSHQTNVMICQYVDEHADKRCLLSDRGYSNPSRGPEMLAFSFNLCSNAFIVYTFTDVTQFAGGTVPPQVIDDFRKQPKRVQVKLLTNELAPLASYNRNVVYQCAHSVFCSSQSVYGLP
jgi:hypothetical protein